MNAFLKLGPLLPLSCLLFYQPLQTDSHLCADFNCHTLSEYHTGPFKRKLPINTGKTSLNTSILNMNILQMTDWIILGSHTSPHPLKTNKSFSPWSKCRPVSHHAHLHSCLICTCMFRPPTSQLNIMDPSLAHHSQKGSSLRNDCTGSEEARIQRLSAAWQSQRLSPTVRSEFIIGKRNCLLHNRLVLQWLFVYPHLLKAKPNDMTDIH